MQDGLAGKTVLVTGSTRGIGRATAERLVRSGAEVIVHGRMAEDADAVAKALPGRARGLAADLSDRGALRALAAACGEVDALVNVAGVYRECPIEQATPAVWRETIEVNLTAPWLLTQALLPGLRRRRGVVVNVASDAALLGYPGDAIYCASKGALAGLTKALAVELAPDVRAICICPGPVATDMMGAALGEDQAGAAWARFTMLGRVARPEEIAAVIAFAASDAASFATGAVWTVDGGATAGRRVGG